MVQAQDRDTERGTNRDSNRTWRATRSRRREMIALSIPAAGSFGLENAANPMKRKRKTIASNTPWNRLQCGWRWRYV